MHCLDAGSGSPTVFLHGNPTSSYLWRKVLGALDGLPGRRIAVDLIGMGASGKPSVEYRLVDHVEYVEALLDALDLPQVTLVGHDWGVAIALECLRRRPDRVAGVALMEGHLRPLPDWHAFDEGGRAIFQDLRTPGVGERMALDENFLIEVLLPAGTNHRLTPAEYAVYAEPYADRASRRPLLQWTREIPIAGHPADVADLLTRAWDAFGSARVRKLLIHGSPGAVVGADTVAWCRQTVPDLVTVDVGPGSHFLPEERPNEIARALAGWLPA